MIKVVLVSNADILIYGIGEILAKSGEAVLTCTVGSLSDYKALPKQDMPDIVMIDIQSLKTPKASDMKKIVEHFRRLSDRIGCIALTDWTNKSRYEFALQLGIKGYCLKKISSHELLKMVKSVAKGERCVHEAYFELIQLNSNPLFNNLLGRRQLEILNLILQGHTNREIAELLHISPETVKSHIKVILKKLNARDRTQAVSVALREMIDVLTQQNLYFN